MNRLIQISILLGILLLILFTACEEPIDWELHPGENRVLAVEAILTNEFKVHEIKLSQTTATPNESVPAVSGATVTLIGTPQEVSFTESTTQPGTYFSDRSFLTQRFVEYQLEINWQGVTYNAQNEMVAVGPIFPFTFVEANNDSLGFRMGNIPPVFSPEEQSMYEVDLDWTHLTNADSSRAKLFYYTLNSIDINQIVVPQKESVFFPKGTIATITKYSLNDDFAEYIRALLMETEWQGGVFDEASSSIPTNFNNGAVGFFGVSAVRTRTEVVK